MKRIRYEHDPSNSHFIKNLFLYTTEDHKLKSWTTIMTLGGGNVCFFGEIFVATEYGSADSYNSAAKFTFATSDMYVNTGSGQKFLNLNRVGASTVQCRIYNNEVQILSSNNHQRAMVMINGWIDTGVTINDTDFVRIENCYEGQN